MIGESYASDKDSKKVTNTAAKNLSNNNAPLFSIAMLSATALAYEILLMRLFSIIQWHHFAYMIISLALLGYGFSGSLLALFRKFLLQHFYILYPLTCWLFSLATLYCYLWAQSIPFNMEAIVWDYRQFLYLGLIFLILSIPFLLVATAICLTFNQFPQYTSYLYGADLFGAGLGAVLVIGLLFWVTPLHALVILSFAGLLSCGIGVWELTKIQKTTINSFQPLLKIGFSLLLPLTALSILWFGLEQELNISPYKELSQVMNISGTQILQQKSSPLGQLSVVESRKIPFRHAPGLSLNNTQEPLAQLALFSDAGNMTAINQYPQTTTRLAYLDQLTSALPYHLGKIEKLLLVGAGGGSDILQAHYHQVANIDVVEHNAQVVELLQQEFATYSGFLFKQPNTQIVVGDIRGFLSRGGSENKQYDLLQISLMDSFNASSSGLYALHESYLYTIEALQLYLQHLAPEGYLAISRWVKTPPRDSLKIFATAIKALEKLNIAETSKHLLLIRGWQTSTLVIKKTPLSAEEILNLKTFCQQRSFDLAWYPGIAEQETNRFNRFREAYFFQAAEALLSPQKQHFLQQYKYYLYPASDDKPFFHHFFKWSLLPELFKLREQGGLALLESSYIIIVATLVLAIIASIVLILLPLMVYRISVLRGSLGWQKKQLFAYFFAIGLAFLFIEIAMMQKFVLFLHHPIYAIPVVLSAFLLFAGLGSLFSERLLQKLSHQQLLYRVIVGIIFLCCIYILFIDALFGLLIVLPFVFKLMISMLLIAPLGMVMGMPFPIALNHLAKTMPVYISWAWGINGYASVISAVLATLLAIHLGFTMVVLFSMLLYLFCFICFPKA